VPLKTEVKTLDSIVARLLLIFFEEIDFSDSLKILHIFLDSSKEGRLSMNTKTSRSSDEAEPKM
jgi:hypothetical protein